MTTPPPTPPPPPQHQHKPQPTPHDQHMIQHAKQRATIRTDTGQTATLISWGIKRRNRRNRNRAILQTLDGQTKFSVPTTSIIEVIDPNPNDGGYTTKSGRHLTDADIEALAAEAERGYNVDNLKAHES